MTFSKRLWTTVALTVALGSTACGRADLGRSPSQVVIDTLDGASGAKPGDFGGTVASDVITNVKRSVNGQQIDVPTIFNDFGRVKMRLVLRDQGTPGSTAIPSALNGITFTRYRVAYVRTDGRNTEGVDVPYGFDSGLTVTVPPTGDATATFELVRHVAKQEAPLATLATNSAIISTIAQVSFYGKDLAGNEVVATGSIGVLFGNFGDPQ